jgi:uncharacterized protein YjaG (DUF416 family)
MNSSFLIGTAVKIPKPALGIVEGAMKTLHSDGSDAGAEQTPSSEHTSLSAVAELLERRARNSVSDKDAVKNFMVND